MRYSDWMQRTQNDQQRHPGLRDSVEMQGKIAAATGATPSVPGDLEKTQKKVQQALVLLDQALLQYENNATEANLEMLRDSFDSWKWSIQKASSRGLKLADWKDSFKKNDPKHGSPAVELHHWIERHSNKQAIFALSSAARVIIENYELLMDKVYSAALIRIFIGANVDSCEPLFCFKWHQTDTKWERRFMTLAGRKPGKDDDGMTPCWDGASGANQVEIYDRIAPFNRSVEFPKLNRHTLVHELLHWCTHEDYRKYTLDHHQGDESRFLREGPTEWLARNALNEWGQGGYKDMFPIVYEAIKQEKLTVEKLMQAYFRGKEIDQVTAILAQSMKTYQAVDTWGMTRQYIVNTIKGLPKRLPARFDKDFRNRAYELFHRIPKEILAKETTAPWADYIDQRKAGKVE